MLHLKQLSARQLDELDQFTSVDRALTLTALDGEGALRRRIEEISVREGHILSGRSQARVRIALNFVGVLADELISTHAVVEPTR